MPVIFWPTGQGAGPAGAADYPAVGDVEAGVSYGSGSYTGTFAVPAVGDVRSGTGYGADGTEFTGTLSVPVSGGSTLVRRLTMAVAQLRAQGLIEAVTVEPRGAGDLYPLSEGWEAHRLPQTSTDAGGLGENRVTWALYKIAGQTGVPNRLCRITDPDGVVWIAESATAGYGRLHFTCQCVRALS